MRRSEAPALVSGVMYIIPKINVFKILQLVTMGIEVAEQVKGPKKGAEKLDYVLEATDAMLPKLEAAIGKDLLRNERVRPFAVRYINAAIDFKNIVEATKALGPEPRASQDE